MAEISFNKIEKKWQKKWEKAKIFNVNEKSKKKKYYVLEMFPYPSGSGLHMGHALNYTIGDIYARFKRMNELNVLYPMGYDALGLPAENAAIKEKTHPKKFTERAIKNFIEQQKALGLSYDWSRIIKTCSPDYYKWNQYFFLKFMEKGLIYRKKAPVNFCKKCDTVLANEQVHNGKCWRHLDTDVEIKYLEQWFIKTTNYAEELLKEIDKLDWPNRIKIMQKNWIGKSEGTEIDFEIFSKRNNYVLLHGYKGTPEKNFFLWLKNELENRGYKVTVPLLPNTDAPNINEQVEYILKNCSFDENTVLLGHSLGSVVALKVIEKLKKPIKKLITVAGFVIPNTKNRPYIKTFNWKYDFNKIKNNVKEILILKDINDLVIRKDSADKIKSAIGGEVMSFKAKEQHFCAKFEPEVLNACIDKFPVFTTRPDTLFGVTFMVISSQHPKLMELVTSSQKNEANNFLKKLKSTKQEDLDKFDKEGVFTGSYTIHPITKEKIPIWVGNFVLADYGSGMVMAVPAHDQRDFEFAKKYNLPIKPVVLKYSDESYSYVMGVDEKDINKPDVKIIEKTKDNYFKIKIPFASFEQYKEFIRDKMKPGFWNEFSTKNGFYFIFKHKDGKIEKFELNDKTNDIIDKYGMTFNNQEPNKIPENVYSWLAKNSFYKELLIHQDQGILINSKDFNDLNSEEAKAHITIYLEEKGLGRKTVNYKLKDWLVSRQRYWGTPIPIIYCEKCGIVPVPENQLPVKLQDKVSFGKGNPLETNKSFVNIKCPNCKGKAKRETDTMDTFFDSSWYFLRFTDSKNNKKPFDNKAIYWMPVDQYIGGEEHACMHLIYARFFTKALRDLGFLNFNEPFRKLFNQGMLHGEDGYVMSKSRGNVVLPEEVSKKYGIDTARLFLVSVASPDKDVQWSEKGIEGSYRFLKKLYEFFNKKIENEKSSKRVESKINKSIKEITNDIENFRYNLAIIKLRNLFEVLTEEKTSKKDLETYLKLLHLFCPHITEELWEKLGNKSFISLQKWPQADESKIDKNIEKQDEIIEQTLNDIFNILKIMREKQGKEPDKIYLYVIPNEISLYNENILSRKTNKQVKIFAVNNKNKFDPDNKSSKSKPGKPGIYVE